MATKIEMKPKRVATKGEPPMVPVAKKTQETVEQAAQRREKKGAPPTEQASQNLSKPDRESLKPLNFRVPGEFHRVFKIYAAERGMSMVDLLRASFEAYRSQQGD